MHKRWVYGGPLMTRCIEAYYEEKYEIYKGTWESNPGPNTCVPLHLPIEPTRLVVCLVDNDHYM